MANQTTKDANLQDTDVQSIAASVAALTTLVQNLSAEVQSLNLKTSSQTQDKTLGTDKYIEQIRDDIGDSEAFRSNLVLASGKQSARDYDNAKMNQADEKDFALVTKFDANHYGKQVMAQSDNYFNQLSGQRDQLFNAYMTHYTSLLSSERLNRDNTLSDERVQKEAMRTPEIQGGAAIGYKSNSGETASIEVK